MRPKAEVDNTLRDLQNSSYPTKAELNNLLYYINTSEIPSELSRENFISSHVKITCYLHT